MTRRSRGHQASIGLDAARGPLVATYQTRISDYADMDRLEGDAALSAYGELYGQVQRKLFAAVAAGRSAVLLKNDYIREYGIPARMFNAGAGVAGRQGVGGAGGAEAAGGQLGACELLKSERSYRPALYGCCGVAGTLPVAGLAAELRGAGAAVLRADTYGGTRSDMMQS